jgi:hypothetical protein
MQLVKQKPAIGIRKCFKDFVDVRIISDVVTPLSLVNEDSLYAGILLHIN